MNDRLNIELVNEALARVHVRARRLGIDRAVREEKEGLSPHEYQILCRATYTTV